MLLVLTPLTPVVAGEPLPDPAGAEDAMDALFGTADVLTRIPCLSLTLSDSTAPRDVNTFLGEQVTGVELTSGALAQGDGVSAVVVSYPVACQAWAMEIIGKSEKDANEIVQWLLP